MQIKDIMTKEVKVITPKTSARDIAKILFNNQLTGVPVVDDGKIIGIVTEADLIMRYAGFHFPEFIQLLEGRIYLENPEKIQKQLDKILGTKAEDIMSKDVISISPEDSLEGLADLIKKEHINPIPVVENDNLVGIVSRADLVRLIANGI